MVLDELLTPSEYRLVLDDLQNLPTNLVENGSQLFSDPPDMSVSSQTDDSDNSDAKPKRKKPKRMCDSTFDNTSFDNTRTTSNMDMLPCLVPYPGQFDFRVQLPADSSAHRWTYSRTLQKVFIDIDKVLALQFKWTVDDMKPQPELYVRAMPVYTSHDSLNIPVVRCPIHLLPENNYNLGFQHINHVMRCEHGSTVYVCDPNTKRLSCITPLSPPQAGADTTTLTYKFVCKTSCLGGMNRKPISVVFTLEDSAGNDFGRQLLAVKICSCPKRDKAKEEKNEQEKNQSCARMGKSMDTPPMPSMRLTDGTSHPHAEPLRDLRNVSFSDNCPWSAEIHRSRSISATSSKGSGKVKREKESDIEVLKAVGQVRDDVAKMAEQVNRLVAEKQTATSKFCLYVESEMNLLPPAAVMELQNEIYKLINEKKTFLLRQNNMTSYCPTPAPSLTSPCPAVNDWQY